MTEFACILTNFSEEHDHIEAPWFQSHSDNNAVHGFLRIALPHLHASNWQPSPSSRPQKADSVSIPTNRPGPCSRVAGPDLARGAASLNSFALTYTYLASSADHEERESS